MLTASFIKFLGQKLVQTIGRKVHIQRIEPVQGGSINASCRISTGNEYFFLKTNDAYKYPAMFEKEVAGLKLIRDTKTLKVPEVITFGEYEDLGYLLLRYVMTTSRQKDFWEVFGSQLAAMHSVNNDKFGLTDNNYIGSLPQSNRQHNKWTDFFIEERLEAQLKIAYSSGKLDRTISEDFKKIFVKIENLVPEEKPSLVHGDLWSGNFLTGNSGEPYVIDPAVYYGHREMDLSMTKLFGGFDEPFYESYNSVFPLAVGFEDRVELHNLYPLLVHVNLFGGSYISQLKSIIKKYS
jgi:protein-ribulosamine 3-kinase